MIRTRSIDAPWVFSIAPPWPRAARAANGTAAGSKAGCAVAPRVVQADPDPGLQLVGAESDVL